MRTYKTTVGILILCLCSSCATLFNGKEQKVAIRVPDNITLKNAELIKSTYGDRYVVLRRDRDTTLVFQSPDTTLAVPMQRHLNGGFIFLDCLPYFVPLLVDGYLQTWWSYKPQEIYYHSGQMFFSENTMVSLDTMVDPPRKKIGVTLLFGAGAYGPITQVPLFFDQVKIGIGYQLLQPLGLYITHQAGGLLDIGAGSYWSLGNVTFQTLNLETKYTVYDPLYLMAGGGFSDFNNSDSAATIQIEHKLNPSIMFGIGLSWELFYLEFYHTNGLKPIHLSDGSKGRFETNTFNFGINLKL